MDRATATRKDWKDYALEERRRANSAEARLVMATSALLSLQALAKAKHPGLTHDEIAAICGKALEH